MLKLLKYEWKACARICLPMYAALLLLSVVTRVMMVEQVQELLYGIPSVLMATLYHRGDRGGVRGDQRSCAHPAVL